MNYRDYLQKLIYRVIDPTIDAMIKMGLTPNAITTGGFVGNVFAAWFILQAALNATSGHFDRHAFLLMTIGGVLILAAGLFDMMDGRLARRGNMSSVFGAMWDSVLDRYSELVTLFAVAMVFVKASDEWEWAILATFLAIIGSLMVSYVRARAEALGYDCKVGLMQRPERVVLTAAVAIVSGIAENLWPLAVGMAVIAVLANITAFWRLTHCYRQRGNGN